MVALLEPLFPLDTFCSCPYCTCLGHHPILTPSIEDPVVIRSCFSCGKRWSRGDRPLETVTPVAEPTAVVRPLIPAPVPTVEEYADEGSQWWEEWYRAQREAAPRPGRAVSIAEEMGKAIAEGFAAGLAAGTYRGTGAEEGEIGVPGGVVRLDHGTGKGSGFPSS